MPAPSDAAVLAYETNIEDAFVAYLKSVYASLQVLTARTSPADEKKNRTPRIELRVQVSSSGAQENLRPRDGKRYRSHKIGTLTVRVVAQRGTAGQDLGLMCGRVRLALEPATAAITPEQLPYYQLVHLVEASGTPSILADNDEIILELGYAIEWWIRPDAWPVS